MQCSHGQRSMGKLKHGRMQCARMLAWERRGSWRDAGEMLERAASAFSPEEILGKDTHYHQTKRTQQQQQQQKKKTKNKTNKPKPKNLCFLEK